VAYLARQLRSATLPTGLPVRPGGGSRRPIDACEAWMSEGSGGQDDGDAQLPGPAGPQVTTPAIIAGRATIDAATRP